MRKQAIPIYSIDITDNEMAQAAQTRKEFESLIFHMDDAFQHLYKLDSALESLKDSANFSSLADLFVKFRRKTKKLFDVFIKQLESSLFSINKMISDSEMVRIKETIVAEIREIRDGVNEILQVLEVPTDPQFIQDYREIVERIGHRANSLEEVITDQLYSHIDHDILGKIRLGSKKPALVIRGEKWDSLNIPLRR